MSSLFDQIYNKAKPLQASGHQWMFKEQSMGVPVSVSPADDPFNRLAAQEKPQLLLPQPPAAQPGEWLKQLYADLHQRLTRGFELLDQPGLSGQDKLAYERRIEQLSWQINLLEAVAREMVPCSPEICACRLGGKRAWDPHDAHRERYIQDLKRIHADGRLSIPLRTPGGRDYTLVPWKSTPPAPGELDPLDLAALARVVAITGTDEMTLLDCIQKQEVTSTT